MNAIQRSRCAYYDREKLTLVTAERLLIDPSKDTAGLQKNRITLGTIFIVPKI